MKWMPVMKMQVGTREVQAMASDCLEQFEMQREWPTIHSRNAQLAAQQALRDVHSEHLTVSLMKEETSWNGIGSQAVPNCCVGGVSTFQSAKEESKWKMSHQTTKQEIQTRMSLAMGWLVVEQQLLQRMRTYHCGERAM
jgi:hypothetical protein